MWTYGFPTAVLPTNAYPGNNGRAAVNVVAGGYRPELEMFGRKLDEHDRRYDLALLILHFHTST